MTGRTLFPEQASPDSGGVPNHTPKEATFTDHRVQVERSALWAAYGDALGWISELTNARGLKRRTSGEPLRRPIEWKRRIGGRAGIIVSLPKGCYSDDSQLRLATGRAIRPSGFDVEAFAKVELPVWLSYGLGGGRSTGAAAMNLAKSKVPWFANRFKGWANSGGNGAAMRVQPHIWAAASPDDPESFLLDVLRNAVCTHSHPTGMMGAVLHSLALARTMVCRRRISPGDLLSTIDVATRIPEIMRHDPEIGSYWLGLFEQEAGSFTEGWSSAVSESKEAISAVSSIGKNSSGASRYDEIVDILGLREPAQRGSGILTAVAATALTWCDPRPQEVLRVAANAIGTDTDTIATMAGAMLGMTAETGPSVEVLDADLFRAEAARLSEIARGGEPQGHDYPDLLHWSAPRARADCLTILDGDGLYVRGLGRAEPISEPLPSPKMQFKWQWLKLETGQTLLIKRRAELAHAGDRSARLPRGTSQSRGSAANHPSPKGKSPEGESTRAATRGNRETGQEQLTARSRSLDLQRALNYVAARSDDDRIIGKALRQVVNEGTLGEIAGFTAGLVELIRQVEDVRGSSQQHTADVSKEDRAS